MLNSDLEKFNVPKDALKGIRNPKVIVLTRGQSIYRFGNSHLTRNEAIASPWWTHEQGYKNIIAKVSHGKMPTGFVARWALAVPQSVPNRLDIAIHAVVLEDIKAYCGQPRTQFREDIAPNGIFITWKGCLDVEQLYIPEISQKPNIMTTLGHRAISVVDFQTIDSFQLWET